MPRGATKRTAEGGEEVDTKAPLVGESLEVRGLIPGSTGSIRYRPDSAIVLHCTARQVPSWVFPRDKLPRGKKGWAATVTGVSKEDSQRVFVHISGARRMVISMDTEHVGSSSVRLTSALPCVHWPRLAGRVLLPLGGGPEVGDPTRARVPGAQRAPDAQPLQPAQRVEAAAARHDRGRGHRGRRLPAAERGQAQGDSREGQCRY